MIAGLEQPPVNFRLQILCVFRISGRRFFFASQSGFKRPEGGILSVAVAVNGNMKFVGDAQQTRNVVAVFVRDQNGREIFRRTSDGGQALPDLTRGKPASTSTRVSPVSI